MGVRHNEPKFQERSHWITGLGLSPVPHEFAYVSFLKSRQTEARKPMKVFFAITLAVLVVWAVVMWAAIPTNPHPDKTPLVWVSDDNPQRVPQIEWFNKLYPDCWLRLDPNNTGVTKVIVQSCAGVGPDIIDVYGIRQLQTYVQAGILLDVTDYAKKMGFSPDVTYEKAAACLMIDGRQYCFPCNVNVNILFYNKNIFDKYGVPYPPRECSWDELVRIAQRVTVRKPGHKLPECFGLASVGWEELIYQAGGSIFNKDGTRCVIDSPEGIRAIRFYRDLMYKYRVMPTPLERSAMAGQGGWGQGWLNWFGSQKIAMITIGKWALITFRRFQEEQRRRFEKWQEEHPGEPYPDLPPLRMGASFLPYFMGAPRRIIIAARSAAVNRLSPHWRKALNFLQYLTTKEYCQTINEGADALPGNKKYGTVELMHSDKYPDEDIINELTVESTKWGVVREISPFIDGNTTQRLIQMQIERLEAGMDVSVEKVLKTAVHDVNKQIRKNIQREPKLRERYERLKANADSARGDEKGARS